MSLIIALVALSTPAFSANLTLVGWQNNDDTRSTWDIVWTCLSTILACTWTVLCLDISARFRAGASVITSKTKIWLVALLCPELIVLEAVKQFFIVQDLVSACNAVQNTSTRGQHFSSVQAQSTAGPAQPRWTRTQGYCIIMDGLALQTRDDQLYTVPGQYAECIVRSGLMQSSDFKDEDVKDRSKNDTLGKVFTVAQSSWLTCNMVARAIFSLPVCPLEIITLGYVFCGLIIYGFWWRKPTDMTTQIIISLPYTRADIPTEAKSILDKSPNNWAPLIHKSRGNISGSVPPSRTHFFFFDVLSPAGTEKYPKRSPEAFRRKMPEDVESLVYLCSTLVALAFSGIHLAEY
ncbi:hypothetical protein QQS21_012028 [Conoideocrella luteorostrata]|uniref:Uncharacterized protein n=1 Tax=Conoideocrella luteorostrata TaxID=1105319 RepID=A0AAJ0FMS7_9HYPO|nr:hypothetical protein QQS21_012028 [Conoideocrella luteorostrata]